MKRLVACAVPFAVLVACGGAAKSPASMPSGGAGALAEPEPTTIEEARAQIERAEAELGGGAPATTAPTVATESPKAEPGKKAEERGENLSDASNACRTPCRAIASMRRAVDALCRMAGATDARCTDAKKTLASSEAHVARCGC